MKIGFFTDSYRPYVSGVVRSIDSFALQLRRRGHQVYIFAPRYPHTGKDEPGVYRFPSFHTPFNPEFYIGLPLPWPAVRYVARWGLDVVHVHSPFMLGQLGAFFARWEKLPLVFTYHTLYDQYVHYFPIAPRLVKRGVITLARNFCNHCDLVITPTGVIRKLLAGYGVTTPVVPIPTGIEPAHFLSAAPFDLRERLGIPPGDKVLLFVGRIGKEKNLDYLLEAFYLVLQQNKRVSLVLVGSGPATGELRRRNQELGISGKVFFTGRLEPEVVIRVYREADIFVFPSVTETQGLVLVEAMAAGLPVVAQAAFGSLAMVQDGITGYLCREGKERFAELVLTLLENPALAQEMGEAGRRRAQRLSADKMAGRLERAYLALLEGDRGAIENLAGEEV